MRPLIAILRRDLIHAFSRSGALLPVVFFLLVATLYPFAVGPDPVLLGRTGGGLLWVAALLASLLPLDRLVLEDADTGMFDQYAVRGIADETVAATKIMAHWLSFAPALMMAAVPAAALLRLDGDMLARIEIGLAIGTPGLAALAFGTASLTTGLRGAGAIAGLLMLPLAIPLLIFAAGSLAPDGTGALKLLAATSLLLTAGAPFVAGAALRAMRE